MDPVTVRRESAQGREGCGTGQAPRRRQGTQALPAPACRGCTELCAVVPVCRESSRAHVRAPSSLEGRRLGHGWPGLGWFGLRGPRGLITVDYSASELLIWLPFDFLSVSPEERAWHGCDLGLGGVGHGWPCFGLSSRPLSVMLVQKQPVQEVTWGRWCCQPSREYRCRDNYV